MIEIVRTDSTDPDFKLLISMLNNVLKNHYGDKQNYYDQFNKIEYCKNVVIVKSDNNSIGCGCFKILSQDTIEIKRMFVKKDYRGKGVSKKILEELESWAKECGFKSAVLETGNKQKEAIGLYKKYDYKLMNNYGPYLGVETSICMQKKL